MFTFDLLKQIIKQPNTDTHTMSRERIRSAPGSKIARLKQWGEDENEDFLSQLDEIDEIPPIDELRTLKLNDASPAAAGLNPPVAHFATKPTISPRMFMKYVEKEDDEISFGNDYDPNAFDMDKVKLNQRKQAVMSRDPKLLPGTLSSASPLRRRSLSDYSEDTDTDITELNDEDFEELDDIFGKEESGLYSSGGTNNVGLENASRASEALNKKRQQLQKEAEIEDHEMYMRYRKHYGDEVNTLKLKDLKNYTLNAKLNKDPLENDHTVNYEYTRDDFETFEDGFEADLPLKLEPSRLRQFQSRKGTLSHKASLPSFPNSLKPSKPTKFKSTMDLASHLHNKDEHPIFNNSNKIIRKLDRMPSFHIKRERVVSNSSQPDSDDLLDRDMEIRKKHLLEKYMEISEQQKKLRNSPKRTQKPSRKGVGLVKYLNDKTSVPSTAANESMKFNPVSKRWEGNEHDLLRFEEGLVEPKKQPSLITLTDFRNHNKIKGSMMYDPENMRWVNLDKVAEEGDAVFDDLPDLVPNDIPQYLMRKPSRPVLNERGVSAFTQRTVLAVSSDRSSSKSGPGDEFQISAKLCARFEKEEQKIKKKTHHWFGPNEHYRVEHAKPFHPEYFWEIRKMVMDNDGK